MKNKNKAIVLGIGIGMVGIILMMFGVSFAIFKFDETSTTQELIMGDIWMKYTESAGIQLENALPGDNYDDYFEFTITGTNTNAKKDIYYDISLTYGDIPSGKEESNRVEDKYLKFKLTEVNGDSETQIFINKTYSDLTNQRVYVDMISKNTNTYSKTYKLYMTISEDLTYGNSSDAILTTEEFSKIFGSVKVNVTGDFNEKESPYEKVIYASNGIKFKVENTYEIFNSPEETWGVGVKYPTILELQYSENYNGKLLASFEVHDSGKTGKPTSFRIMESNDSGNTWKEISQVYETIDTSIEASWNPQLFELPEQLGDLKKGTILLAGCSIDSSQSRKSQLSIWRSEDAGKTWEQYSVLAEAGGIEDGVWEPYLFYDNGYLYCFYSDDSGNEHDQKIVYKRTSDGKNWEEMVYAVAADDYTYRPGMPVVTKMGNGKYFMAYEIFGDWDGAPIYYKISSDITSWYYTDIGQRIEGTTGYTMGSSPWAIWIPAGGEKGTLIVTAKYGSSSPNKIFVSFDYGETFEVIENPLPHSDLDGMGYSASLFVSNNKNTILYANTIDYQNEKAKIAFSRINISNSY